MKKRIIFFLFFLITVESSAQHTFSKFYNNEVYGNRISDQGKDFIQLPDGGFLFPTLSINLYSTDTLGYAKTYLQIIRTNINGDTVFRKIYFKKHYSLSITLIAKCNDSSFLLVGHSFDLVKYDKDSTGAEVLVIKIDSNGDTIWTKSMGIGDGDELTDRLISTKDGGFAIFGQTCNKQETNCDYYLMKLDSNGNKLWHHTYSWTPASWEIPMSMAETKEGEFLLAGYTDGVNIAYLVKADSAGNLLWQKRIDRKKGYPVELLTDVSIGDSNTYLVCGIAGTSTISIGHFARLDTSGNILMEKQVGNPNKYTNFLTIIENNGIIYAQGETNEYLPVNGNHFQTTLYSYTNNGTPKWSRIYGDSLVIDRRYLIYRMKSTLENGFAMIGWGKNPKDTIFQNSQDVWLFKVDSNGCLYNNCKDWHVGMETNNASKTFKCFPNPAHHEISIESDEEFQSFLFFNLLGQEVKRLDNPISFTINIEDLPDGIYVLKATTNLGEEFIERIVVN